MRVIVDTDLCEANAVCVSLAPAVFELRADDTLVVIDQTPRDGMRATIEEAVAGCPRAAIRIEAE